MMIPYYTSPTKKPYFLIINFIIFHFKIMSLTELVNTYDIRDSRH